MHVPQEPLVNTGYFIDPVNAPAAAERFMDYEHALTVGPSQFSFDKFIGHFHELAVFAVSSENYSAIF